MTTAPAQMENDVTAVKQRIILTILLDVLERDIEKINMAQLKMPYIYVMVIQAVQNKVTTDLFGIRKDMQKQGIKIYDETRTKEGIQALYLCRGYHHQMLLLWDIVKAEIELRLVGYYGINIMEAGTT